MSYNSLRALLQATIYPNFNNEINGQEHQDFVDTLITSLGYLQFKGRAALGENPSAAQLETSFWYWVDEPGVYTNLGNITLPDGEAGFIMYENGLWNSVLFPFNQGGGDIQFRGRAALTENPALDDNFWYWQDEEGNYPNLGNTSIGPNQAAFLRYLKDSDTWDQILVNLGAGGGNTFSPQFKTLDGDIWVDPAYIAADYPSTPTEYNFELNLGQPAGDLAPCILDVSAGLDDKNLSASFEVKINGSFTVSQMFAQLKYDYSPLPITFNSPVQAVSLDGNWQTVTIPISTFSFPLPPYSPLTYTIIATSSSTLAGDSFDFRNFQVIDEDTNEVIIGSVDAGAEFTKTEVTEDTLEGTRIQHKILVGAGVLPTVPADLNGKPRDPGWLPTDIMEGEKCWNYTDNIWYHRKGSTIYAEGGGGSVLPPTTTEPATAALKFDKPYWPTTANALVFSGSDITLSLNTGVSNVVGNINYFKILADGIGALLLNADFDSDGVNGIESGDVLGSGEYWAYAIYGPDSKIHINVPKGALGTLPLLGTPTGFIVTPDGNTKLDLTWINVANNAGYRIDQSPNGVDTWTLLANLAADIVAYTHSGLAPAQEVFYRIKALGDNISFQDSLYATANGTTGAFAGNILISDDFTGTTIDDTVWQTPPTVGGEGSIAQNDEIIWSQPGPTNTNNLANLFLTDNAHVLDSNTLVLAFDLKSTLNAAVWGVGLYFDGTHRVEIFGSGANNVSCVVRNGGTGEITTTSGIGNDLTTYNRFKLVYAAGAIEFFRWNVSAWVSLATTTSLISNSFPVNVQMRGGYNGTAYTANLDRVRLTDADYTDELPD